FFDHLGLKVQSRLKGLNRPLGEELLVPTRIYVKTVLNLIRDFPVQGIAHITGGGFTDNIPRVVPKGCKVVIHKGTWPILPIFKALEEGGRVREEEMFRTFNNGIGLVLIVPSSKANSICDRLKNLKEKPYRIGEIAEAGRGERLIEYR
ncbi:MAG: phosphoribosylformylglycinamidine cyclo-ligase, partial [Deltaproteobacteria bacterium]